MQSKTGLKPVLWQPTGNASGTSISATVLLGRLGDIPSVEDGNRQVLIDVLTDLGRTVSKQGRFSVLK